MSGPKHQPWLKWYPADWRAEPRLKLVSRAARSLWVDMLGLMHEAEPCGFLIVGGTPLLEAKIIARVLGDREKDIAPLLAELEAAGVYSRVGNADLPDDLANLIPANIPAGTIFSRKMIRDYAKANKDRANGGRGGNPFLKAEVNPSDKGGVNPPDNHQVNPRDKGGVKAQKPEARSTLLRKAADAAGSLERGEDPPASQPPPADPKSWLFGDGVSWLRNVTGREAKGVRSLIGKWLKAAKEDAVALCEIIATAREQNVAEPVAWITKAIEARPKTRDPFEAADPFGWEQRLEEHKRTGTWPAKWGGRGPGDHAGHRLAMIAPVFAKYGYTFGGAEAA